MDELLSVFAIETESFICQFNKHLLIACNVPVTEETNMNKTLSLLLPVFE